MAPPVSPMASPVSSMASPVSSMASPVSPMAPPVSPMASPVSSVASPVSPMAPPVSPMASPVSPMASPVSLEPSAVSLAGSVVSQQISQVSLLRSVCGASETLSMPPVLPSSSAMGALIELLCISSLFASLSRLRSAMLFILLSDDIACEPVPFATMESGVFVIGSSVTAETEMTAQAATAPPIMDTLFKGIGFLAGAFTVCASILFFMRSIASGEGVMISALFLYSALKSIRNLPP